MASKAQYEPIPDVEQPAETPQDPKERYPGTTEVEANFLASVDDCISGSRMEIGITHVPDEDDQVASWTACGCLCVLTLWSFAVFGAAVYLANAKIQRSANFVECFPYAVGIVLFLISSFIIDGRIMSHIVFVFEAVNKAAAMLALSIDGFAKIVNGKVSSIQAQLSQLLAPIKRHIDRISNREALLKKIDPEVDIPDPSDVERELESGSAEVDKRCQEVKEAVDLDNVVPSYLQSECAFRCRTVIPLLLLFLVLQMLSAYAFRVYYPLEFAHKELTIDVTEVNKTVAEMTNATMNVSLPVNSSSALTLAKMMHETSQFLETAEVDTANWVADSWYYVLAVLQAYVVAFIEISLVVCCTGITATTVFINKLYDDINESANRVAREKGLDDATEDILGTRMERIKVKYMELLDKRAKLNGIVAKLPPGSMPRQESKTIATVTSIVQSPRKPEPAPKAGKKQRFGRFFGKGKKDKAKN